MSLFRVWLVAVTLLLPLGAQAGRRAHLFTEEAETVPEGDVELEQWVWSDGRIPARPESPVVTWVWWAPVIGLSPHLELQLPLQLAATSESTELDSVEAVLRYRLFPREKDDGFQPLIRLAYHQGLSIYAGPPSINVDAVVTYGSPTSVRFTANLGGSCGIPALKNASGPLLSVGTAALGASIPLTPTWRLAAETYGQAPLGGAPLPGLQLYAGPSLEWTRGHIWLTFGTLVGLNRNSSRVLPRVLWAVVL